MFSGLTNQMSNWMGKKQDGDVKPPEEERVPDPGEVEISDQEGKKESPTKAVGGKLEMLGNIGGSVKSQMSNWLGGGIPGLRKGAGSGEAGEVPTTPPQPPTPTTDISKKDEEDDNSSATGGADSEHNLSEGEGTPTEDKDGAAFGTAISSKAITGVKTFGNFLYSAANKAGKTVSEASAKIKKTVEENTLLGEFDKAQEAFLKEKAGKGNGSGVPPWAGRTNEEALKEECLSLSTDRRNFVRAPPEGVEFQFDLDTQYPIALATLAEDPNLEKMRFELVPKVINEENFWRNYFYRVGLICQAHEVSSMAQEGDNRSSSVEAEPTGSRSGVLVGAVESVGSSGLVSDGSPQHEFVSDGFTASTEDLEEVKEGMRKLGIQAAKNEEEWEKELEAELQDYEMVGGEAVKHLDNSQLENELDDLK